jgi:tetratricopeptide (TPR) repeat protein
MKIPTSVTLCMFVVLCFVAVAPKAARADKQAAALFQQGKKAMLEKKYDAACKAFEQSQTIEPLIGTQMNVGLCYEQWGKSAKAHAAFRKAQQLAEANKDDRADKIGDRAAALESLIGLVDIRLPDNIPAEKVQLFVDDNAVSIEKATTTLSLEAGSHKIRYRIGSSKEAVVTLELSAGERREETLKPGKSKEKDAADAGADDNGDDDQTDRDDDRKVETPKRDTQTAKGRGQRIIGITMVTLGSVAMGASGYLAYQAKQDYRAGLLEHCESKANMCNEQGLSVTAKARKDANIASIVFGAGLGTAIAGGIVYLVAPRARATVSEHAIYLRPTATGSAASFVVGGRF